MEQFARWGKALATMHRLSRRSDSLQGRKSFEVELESLHARLEAAGPNPASAVDDHKARAGRVEGEVGVRLEEFTRRSDEIIDPGRSYGFAGVRGSATSANSTANTHPDTGTNAKNNVITSNASETSPATREQSISELRAENKHLCRRIKMHQDLADDALRFIDGHQQAADQNVRFLEEALVVCDVSRYPCSFAGLSTVERQQIGLVSSLVMVTHENNNH